MQDLLHGAAFCAGCPAKGNFCDSLRSDTRVSGTTIPDEHIRSTGKATLKFSFTDRDGMTSKELNVNVGEVPGIILTQQTRKRAEYYLAPGAGQLAINAVAALREQLANRVERCSGPGTVNDYQGGYAGYRPFPTCPAVNPEVVEVLLAPIQSPAQTT